MISDETKLKALIIVYENNKHNALARRIVDRIEIVLAECGILNKDWL